MDREKLKDGDVIFISIPNWLYRRVASDTGSKASHVGILFFDAANGWVVAESTIPFAKFTKLEKFIARSDQGWYCVRRFFRSLTSNEVLSLRNACERRMGKLYHPGFQYRSSRLFCSKLVYDAYKHATGVEIGRLETFNQLFDKRPKTSLIFWRAWYFGFIPWQRLTITPGSQMESRRMVTIYDADTQKNRHSSIKFTVDGTEHCQS